MNRKSTYLILVIVAIFGCSKQTETDIQSDSAESSKLHSSGLIEDENVEIIVTNCTSCHSAKLITQNRASREGWVGMIEWMQETQNLWELGDNEEIIVNYLVKYYSPKPAGRRKPLANVDWYELQ